MPDSMSSEDLRNLRALDAEESYYYPTPPEVLNKQFYPYTYFMGDAASQAHRKLVPGSKMPVTRLREWENISSKQPYVIYDDVELYPHTPQEDYFPFQSYYYLMDYDEKGPVAAVPGKTAVPYSLVRIRGRVYRIKTPGRVVTEADIPVQPIKHPPSATTSYISLEGGWW